MTQKIAAESHRLVIPAGIDLPKGVTGAKLCCLLHYVLTLTCLTDERRHQGHWINVHWTRWELLLSSGYRKTIDAALAAGFIEFNQRYSDGSKTAPFPKSVRLTKKYRSGKAQIAIVTNRPAIRRVTKVWEPDAQNLGETGLWWFNHLASFEIDNAAANDPALLDPWTQAVLARLLDGDHVASRCEFRRFHTLLTRLARDARQHLTTSNGESLSLVDVSACQPLIIGILAATQPTNPTKPRPESLLPYAVDFSRSRDLKKWIELCESREIYDYLHNRVKSLSGSTEATITTPTGRRVRIDLATQPKSAFKRQSLIPLFCSVSDMMRSPVWRVIEEDFPTVAAFVIKAKTKSYRIGRRTISHQVLACMAQRFEAETIVDDVGAYLMQHHPDVPVATIHDAILCRQSFAPTAQQIIKSQFERFGVSPRVIIENL